MYIKYLIYLYRKGQLSSTCGAPPCDKWKRYALWQEKEGGEGCIFPTHGAQKTFLSLVNDSRLHPLRADKRKQNGSSHSLFLGLTPRRFVRIYNLLGLGYIDGIGRLIRNYLFLPRSDLFGTQVYRPRIKRLVSRTLASLGNHFGDSGIPIQKQETRQPHTVFVAE